MSRLDDPDARSPRLGFVGGVPAWLADTLRFCSRCGAELVRGPLLGEDRERHHCDRCGFVAYVNPRLVVTTLPVTDDGQLVLLRRGIEPGYDLWAQPGGFLEADETVMEGALRETREETGLLVELTRIVGLYSRVQAGIAVAAYEARIVGGQMSSTPESLEVRPFDIGQLPWSRIAFSTTVWAVRDWVRLVRPDLDVRALARGESTA